MFTSPELNANAASLDFVGLAIQGIYAPGFISEKFCDIVVEFSKTLKAAQHNKKGVFLSSVKKATLHNSRGFAAQNDASLDGFVAVHIHNTGVERC